MVLEIRIYIAKPGLRDRFVDFFRRHAAPAQTSDGMRLLGPFLNLKDEQTVVCVRAFESHAERERVRRLFYEDTIWKDRLKPEANSLVNSHTVFLVETDAATLTGEELVLRFLHNETLLPPPGESSTGGVERGRD